MHRAVKLVGLVDGASVVGAGVGSGVGFGVAIRSGGQIPQKFPFVFFNLLAIN